MKNITCFIVILMCGCEVAPHKDHEFSRELECHKNRMYYDYSDVIAIAVVDENGDMIDCDFQSIASK